MVFGGKIQRTKELSVVTGDVYTSNTSHSYALFFSILKSNILSLLDSTTIYHLEDL